MRKSLFLSAASVFAAVAMVAAWPLLSEAALQLNVAPQLSRSLGFAWLLLMPGFAAGLCWGLGAGRTPRPELTALVLVILAAVLGLSLAVASVPWSRRYLELLDWWSAVRLAGAWLTVFVPNAWALWFGAWAGRRLGRGRLSPVRVAAIALIIAAFTGTAWSFRPRLLPDRPICGLVFRYGEARTDGRYGDAVACFTPEYLRREFGAPPYAPKMREACQRQAADLGESDRRLCVHYPGHSERIPGTDMRRGHVTYHIGPRYDWSWDVTYEWTDRGWRIADMRLDLERSYAPEGRRHVQGPGGTGCVVNLAAHAAGDPGKHPAAGASP